MDFIHQNENKKVSPNNSDDLDIEIIYIKNEENQDQRNDLENNIEVGFIHQNDNKEVLPNNSYDIDIEIISYKNEENQDPGNLIEFEVPDKKKNEEHQNSGTIEK